MVYAIIEKVIFMKMSKGSWLLLFASMIWGSTFVAQSKGMDYIGPFTYNTARFFLGFLVLAPIGFIIAYKKKAKNQLSAQVIQKSVVMGLIIGIPLALASSLQQVGIVYTTAAKAGFITALYIVIVPLLGLFFHKKVSFNCWIAVLIAIIGFYFLSVTDQFTINGADLCLVGCAFLFSIQILGIDYAAKDCDPIIITAMMFFTSALISLVLTVLFETFTFQQLVDCAGPIAYAGILSCGIAYTLQTVGQRDTEPTVASLLMSLESVFAAITGYLVLHNTFTFREFWGCVLIFAGVILSQIPSKKDKLQ